MRAAAIVAVAVALLALLAIIVAVGSLVLDARRTRRRLARQGAEMADRFGDFLAAVEPRKERP